MNHSLKINSSYGGNIHVEFETPNQCPMCKQFITPSFLDAYYEERNRFSVFYFCPSCKTSFITRYSEIAGIYTPTASEPTRFVKTKFSDDICNISSSFPNIYNQALHAEELRLTDVCGMGYRKSLEFLIKDYCLFTNPDDSETIKSMNLSQCINKYLNSYKPLQNVSTIATWLGNDETHYIKRFSDKDINDLKKYINATVKYIELDALQGEASNIITSHLHGK